MKKILLPILIVISVQASAQQDPVYAQYMLNPLVINPAYAGLSNNFNAAGSYRMQWTGYEGQPNTFNFNTSNSISDNKAGVGFSFSHDKIGNTKNTEVNASFAYKLDLGSDKVLSFGMQAGVVSYRIDNSDLSIFDPTEDVFLNNESGTKLNLGAGAILKSSDFLLGVSVPRILPVTFKQGDQKFELYNRHFYLFGAYIFEVNERIKFKPTALVRAVKGAPLSTDFGANFIFNNIHNAGLFTRNLNTYGVLLQTIYHERYRLGYAFELPSNKSVGGSFTTHEITLGVRLSISKFHEATISGF